MNRTDERYDEHRGRPVQSPVRPPVGGQYGQTYQEYPGSYGHPHGGQNYGGQNFTQQQNYGGDGYSDPNAPVPIMMKNKTGTRLFLGSVASECTDDTFIKLIEEILGKKNSITDVFVNAEKGFAFIDMDTRENATAVKNALDGRHVFNRNLVVRRANHKSSIWVGHIPSCVSNEILYKAFERFFGPVDRAIVVCDSHGKPLGWGFVEFTQKRSSKEAVERCSKEMFLLTKYGRPVKVDAFVPVDDEDGLPEHKISRNDRQSEQVSVAPDFVTKEADPDTFEWCKKWKDLQEKHAKQKSDLKTEQEREIQEMEREEKKAMADLEIKRRNEERAKQEQMWNGLHEARMAAAKAQRELVRAEQMAMNNTGGGGGGGGGAAQFGGAMGTPQMARPPQNFYGAPNAYGPQYGREQQPRQDFPQNGGNKRARFDQPQQQFNQQWR